MNKPLLVAPMPNEALRYHVQSSSKPQSPYMVDLSLNNGNGACQCADWITRRNIAIKGGSPLFTRATSCKHVLAARRYFTVTTLTEMARLVTEQEAPPPTQF